MEQAEDLAVLLVELRKAMPHISIGMFTGYSSQELVKGVFRTRDRSHRQNRADVWRSIRNCLDFAVTGRYNAREPSADPLRSSRNQQLHLFSTRHTESDFDQQAVEISISASGLTAITGFPTLGIPV